MMRRVIWRAPCRSFGHGVHIGAGVGFKHIETFEVGAGVFVAAQAYIQGRFDGVCRIGSHVWIGPQSYFDARDLVLEDYVGWGPGAKVLGSEHTGVPAEVPIIQTDLRIEPVVVKRGADIGTGAVILPGVTVGKGAIVGAGAAVTESVPDFAIVAGVPARMLRLRGGAKCAVAAPVTGDAGLVGSHIVDLLLRERRGEAGSLCLTTSCVTGGTTSFTRVASPSSILAGCSRPLRPSRRPSLAFNPAYSTF